MNSYAYPSLHQSTLHEQLIIDLLIQIGIKELYFPNSENYWDP